jgi:hypothetical protein
MDAQAIKNLGGALQIIGVVIVVWDLLNVHQYLGDLTRLKASLQARRVRVEGWLRRLLRLPGRGVVVHAGSATASMGMAGSATGRATPGPFTPQPDLSPAEQLAAQAEYMNRLRDWIMREVQQRDEAIDAERAQARAALQAEGQRLERLLDEVREEVDRLRELTTGGIGVRWWGVPVLLAGVAFSTWPDGWAEVWPAWLSAVALGFLATCGLAVWICWAILARLGADDTAST